MHAKFVKNASTVHLASLVSVRNDADVVDDVLALNGFPAVAKVDAKDHLRPALAFRAEAEGASGQQRRYRRHAQMTDARFDDVVACIDRYTIYCFTLITSPQCNGYYYTTYPTQTGRKTLSLRPLP